MAILVVAEVDTIKEVIEEATVEVVNRDIIITITSIISNNKGDMEEVDIINKISNKDMVEDKGIIIIMVTKITTINNNNKVVIRIIEVAADNIEKNIIDQCNKNNKTKIIEFLILIKYD